MNNQGNTGLGTSRNTDFFNKTNYRYKIVVNATNKNKLQCHKDPDYTSKVVATLENGKTYYSDEQAFASKWNEYYWYVNDLKGWIAESEAVGKCTLTQEKRTVKYNIVTDEKNKIIVRKKPDKKSDQVKLLIEGAKIVGTKIVKGTDGKDWYYIKEYDGYVQASDLKSATKKTTWGDYKTKEQKEEEEAVKKAAEQAIHEKIYGKVDKDGNVEGGIMNKSDNAIAKMKNISKWLSSGSKKEQAAKLKRLQSYADDQAAVKYFDSKNGGEELADLSAAVSKLFNGSQIGVFGSPYQFDENTDEKLEGTEYGITYAKKILTRTPLLLITPGKASYMSDFRQSDKWTEIEKLLGVQPTDENDANQVSISDLIGGSASGEIVDSGRYFTFEFNGEEYFDYVNGMCRAGAKFLGIENSKISVYNTSTALQYKLSNFNWKYAVNSTIKKNIRAQETISFYVDSYSSCDEDFSNTTTESQIASKVNSFADIGRELQFLMGTATGDVPDWMQPNNLESTLADMKAMSDEYLHGHQLLTDLAQNFATVATGGQLLFPEIWADHEYSKSYSVTLKLRTPDNDLLSWYLNIYVPLCHLVCLTAPRQVSSDVANGYMSPFLIRAYLKGAFNCDCGIVTSLSISRGKEGSWTINGLPTEVDVNMSFKDLYSMIILTKASKADWFMANTALMDYIACNCGVNINEPDIRRQLTMYFSLKKNEYLQLPNRTWGMFTQELSNRISNMYSRMGI